MPISKAEFIYHTNLTGFDEKVDCLKELINTYRTVKPSVNMPLIHTANVVLYEQPWPRTWPEKELHNICMVNF